MREGSVLILAVGGNITQYISSKESSIQKLEPASKELIQELIVGKDRSSTSLMLFENNNSKGVKVRIQVERIYEHDNIEQQDSSQVNPDLWTNLVKQIKQHENNFEGIVVLHGLDTMSYTAAAVCFMIRNLKIPIVFTGSQRPLNFIRSDALQNIYASISFAAAKCLGLQPIREVTIYLHDTLFRANRATMSSASSYRSFDSLNFPPLATIGENIDINDHLITNEKNSSATSYSFATDANIQIIDVFPGMSPRVIEGLIGDDLDLIYLDKLKAQARKIAMDNGEVYEETDANLILSELSDFMQKNNRAQRFGQIKLTVDKRKVIQTLSKLNIESEKKKLKGVVLRTYGMGTAPTHLNVLKALQKLVNSDVIVMNVTQAHSSKVSFSSDPVSLRLLEHGVISGLDMTAESAFAKMVVILSDHKNIEKGKLFCEEELQKNRSGEQSHSIINFHFEKGEITELSNENFAVNKLLYLEKGKGEKDIILQHGIGIRRDNIQLRLLGLQKTEKRGGVKVQLKLIRCDDDSQDISEGITILEAEVSLKKSSSTKEEIGTVNKSYDISEHWDKLFSRNATFYLLSDQGIKWTRISIVVYA